MKLVYPIFIFVVLSFNAFAQNWSPVVEGDVYHYELVGDTPTNTNPVAATMWIDSVSTDLTGATTSHLNKIVKLCDSCPLPQEYGSQAYLQNQLQFLGGDMVITNDCEYKFTLDNELLLKPCAPVGETWVFENSGGITAEVFAITEGEVLGNIDSLKHIALSNGDTIILSKSHGIIEFPQLDDDIYYQLIGIQTRDLGFKMPDYREFFDFNIGDVLQYEISTARQPLYSNGTIKITITGKEESQDAIVYEYNKIHAETTYTTSYGMGTDEVHSLVNQQTNHTHTVTKDNVTNFYPNQLFDISEYCLGASDYNYCGDLNFDFTNTKHTLYLEQNQDGKWIKRMYSADFGGSSDFESYFVPIPDSTDVLGDGASYFGSQRIWEEGLGQTYFNHGWFEGNSIRELTAYVIDGDTTGTITPDDVLIAIADVDENSQITLNPNPASNVIYFDIQTNIHLQKIQVSIYDSVGKTFTRQKIDGQQSGSIDISNLPSGIYFISFQTSEGIISRKFVKS